MKFTNVKKMRLKKIDFSLEIFKTTFYYDP